MPYAGTQAGRALRQGGHDPSGTRASKHIECPSSARSTKILGCMIIEDLGLWIGEITKAVPHQGRCCTALVASPTHKLSYLTIVPPRISVELALLGNSMCFEARVLRKAMPALTKRASSLCTRVRRKASTATRSSEPKLRAGVRVPPVGGANLGRSDRSDLEGWTRAEVARSGGVGGQWRRWARTIGLCCRICSAFGKRYEPG